MWNWLLLFAGFILLIPAANYLVESASSLARRMNVPDIVIGLSIVAFGTSLPELFVTVVATIDGNPGLVFGNLIGSNIFNILLVLGLSAVISPLIVKRTKTWIEIPICLLTAIIILLLAPILPRLDTGIAGVGPFKGLFLFAIFIGFIIYNYFQTSKKELNELLPIRTSGIGKAIVVIIAGLALLIIGARLIVTASLNIAEELGFSERAISLTILAAGTSLPELATSVAAVRKGNSDLAIGNIVGSNIINVTLIFGLSSIINPMILPYGALTDLMVNVLASLLLFIFIFVGKGRKLERIEGILFVSLYVTYFFLIVF